MNRKPAINVFDYVDGRGTRDDDNDSRDPYVKHRTTCAQVVHILLTRISDPARVPSVGATELDALYHEQTNLDIRGESVQLVRDVLARCDEVCSYLDVKAMGRRKFPKIGLFCLAMFFQDMRKNPLLKIDRNALKKLAHSVSDGALKSPPRSYVGLQIQIYYDDWREALPINIGFEIDPRRLFSDSQKDELWKRVEVSVPLPDQKVRLSERRTVEAGLRNLSGLHDRSSARRGRVRPLSYASS